MPTEPLESAVLLPKPDSLPASAARAAGVSAGRALGMSCAVTVGACLAWGVALVLGIQVSVWETPRPLPGYHLRLANLPAGPLLPLAEASQGRDVFVQTCAACHGAEGLGKQGMGKSLVHSDFVADAKDAALVAFVTRGRAANDPANTSKVAMPPKGGNPNLTEADLASVVTYLRGLQDPRRLPELPEYVIKLAPLSEDDKAKAMAAAGGDAELAEIIQSGTKLFNATCISCHGAGGQGIKGNGKTLANNEFIKSTTQDDDLLAFVKHGRAPSDPKNTTGIQMPPKGGNPALSDDDILDVIAYLRTLQGTPPAPGK